MLDHYLHSAGAAERKLNEHGDPVQLGQPTPARLGDTHLAAARPDEAHEVWQQALAILEELDHPDADEVRARLRDQAVCRMDEPASAT
jgi:hypothetical protein